MIILIFTGGSRESIKVPKSDITRLFSLAKSERLRLAGKYTSIYEIFMINYLYESCFIVLFNDILTIFNYGLKKDDIRLKM